MAIRVLLVDDEEEFVKSLAQRLEVRDFEVQALLNGDDAVSWLHEHDADVVILDVLMPGKDGIDTLKDMKQLKPLVEVIMLTGHGTVQTGIQGMKLGAYDYLMKPTDMQELVEKINAAYARKSEQEKRIQEAEIQHIMKTKGW
jgi:two-component system response regulator CpxR